MPIVSLSLGATRRFSVRNRATKETQNFELAHGSLIIMHPGCQATHVHRIAKTAQAVGERINWTFRPHTGPEPMTATTDKLPQRRAKTRATAAKTIAQISESVEVAIDSPMPKKSGWQVGDRCQLKTEASGVAAGELATVIRVNSAGGVDIECDNGAERIGLNPKFYLKRSKQAKASLLKNNLEPDYRVLLVDMPLSGEEFKSAIANASLAEIQGAIVEVEKRPKNNKTRLQQLQSALKYFEPVQAQPEPEISIGTRVWNNTPAGEFEFGDRIYHYAWVVQFTPESELCYGLSFRGPAHTADYWAANEDLVPFDTEFFDNDLVEGWCEAKQQQIRGIVDLIGVTTLRIALPDVDPGGRFSKVFIEKSTAKLIQPAPNFEPVSDNKSEANEAMQHPAESPTGDDFVTSAEPEERILVEAAEPANAGFNVGDRVRIISGSLQGAIAQIAEIEPEGIRLNLTGKLLDGTYQPEDLERFEAVACGALEVPTAQYEYTPIAPVAIHFRECGDRVVEGIAIAKNGLSWTRIQWGEERESDVPPDRVVEAGEIAPISDSLPQLASQINQLHTEAEQALTVARSAEKSALQHARACGELLLQAKAAIGHGGWEKWREANLQIPSSSATLYQRIAQRWDELAESATVADLTLRDAAKLLKGDRAAKSANPVATQPSSPATAPEAPQAPKAAIAPETRTELAAAGLQICTPSITPAEFNREMWGEAQPVSEADRAKVADFQQRQREDVAKAAIAQLGAKTLVLFALEQCCEAELAEIGKYLDLLVSYKKEVG